MSNIQKLEMQKLINEENGINFHKNIDLSGYTFYRGVDNFISFKLIEVNNIQVAKINYIYVTSKKNLIKLLSLCINFWSGNAVKYIYFVEHLRSANYCQKYLKTLGFNILEEERDNFWEYEYKSTNGYKENEIREYHL